MTEASDKSVLSSQRDDASVEDGLRAIAPCVIAMCTGGVAVALGDRQLKVIAIRATAGKEKDSCKVSVAQARKSGWGHLMLDSSSIGALDERFRQSKQRAPNRSHCDASSGYAIADCQDWRKPASTLSRLLMSYADNRAIAVTGSGLAKVKRTD